MVEIFSTARAVREFYKSFLDKDQLLPKAITIAEFEQKALFVPGLVLIDDNSRILLMQEASAFDNFKKLHIPHEFMAFLQNSNYLFRFFEELSHEEIEIEKLLAHDTYAEFNEHILILQELHKRYSILLEKNGFYDKITLPKKAVVNKDYLISLKSVRLHIEGFLSKFEHRLFEQSKEYLTLHVKIALTPYNKNMQNWLLHEGIKTEQKTLVECNLNEKKLISSEPLYTDKTICSCTPFSSRSLQAGFVFYEIEKMVKSGILAENIAVILPDENFAIILKELDKNRNLNFAMGTNMSHSKFYQRVDAVLEYQKYGNHEQSYRLKRIGIDADENLNIKQNVSENIDWLKKFHDEKDPKNESDKINEALFEFEKFLEKAQMLTKKEAATLFLKILQEKRIDDVMGGKVTVIGALETRGAKYEGVIIVDFNDDIVPEKSQKDMFLSSQLRKSAGIPTQGDRENLQRFFYERVINSAKTVAISYVVNEESQPSRFLKTLQIEKKEYEESLFFPIIFKNSEKKVPFSHEEIILKHNFFEKPLSATSIGKYLSCPRKYYFSNILGYKEAIIPTNEINNKDIGIALHEVLKELFSEKIKSKTELKNRASALMKKYKEKSLFMELELDIWLLKLEQFFDNEYERHEEGWRVYKLEDKRYYNKNDLNLVGKIDRIDKKDSSFLILDYKSGNIASKIAKKDQDTDFQLQFYALLCEDLGDVLTPVYYELSSGKILEEKNFEEKKEKLLEILKKLKKEKEFNFHQTEDTNICKYCPYIKLCRDKHGF